MDDSKLHELLDDCRSDDSGRQISAVMELDDLGVVAAVPELIALLQSSDSAVRQVSVRALGRLGLAELDLVGPEILKILNDSDLTARCEGIEALGALRYRLAVPPLVDRIDDSNPLIRTCVVEALGEIGDPLALTAIATALADGDETVRSYAAAAYGLTASVGAVVPLVERSGLETSARVRAALAVAQARLDALADLTPVVDILNNANEQLALQIFNQIQDFVLRCSPSGLDRHANLLREAIRAAADEHEVLRGHFEQLDDLISGRHGKRTST